MADSSKPTYLCACHERMGNDFWFLPRNSCLYHQHCGHNSTLIHAVARGAGIEEHIELHAEPAGERDPFRGGLLV